MHPSRSEAIIFLWIINSGFRADIFKCAVRLLVIKSIALSLQSAWTTHHRHSAKLTKVLNDATWLCGFRWVWWKVVQINLRVAWNKQIQTPVTIVISEACACTPALTRNTQFFRHVSKCAVAIVVIKTRHAEVADINIWTPVVVVIPNCDTHAPAFVCDTRFVSDVFKFPVSQIAIQRRVR